MTASTGRSMIVQLFPWRSATSATTVASTGTASPADSIETTASMLRVPGDHLTARRSGRVHALVVEDDLHLPTPGFVERKAHACEQCLGHPAEIARQPDPGMEDEAVHTVRLEVVDLADQLLGVEIVVPEPERQQ